MIEKNVSDSIDEARAQMRNRIDEDIDRLKSDLRRDVDKAVDRAFAPLFWISVLCGVAAAVILTWSNL